MTWLLLVMQNLNFADWFGMKSRFIENLKKLSQSSVPHLGFGHRKEDRKAPPLMLVYSLDSISEGQAAASVADAILFPSPGKNMEAIKKQIQSSSAPWGIALKSSKDAADLKEIGFDFLVFSARESEASLLRAEEQGKVIEIDPNLPDSQLKALDFFPVDALLLPFSGKENTLKVQDLLVYHRIDLLVTKPLLGYVPAKISSEDLRLLWEAGLDGVVLKEKDYSVEELEKLKGAVKSFPSHRGKKKTPEALVPSVASTIPEETLEAPE